ncbi:Zinc finger protein [Astathelohania contejeani]|uniref:Zinc finger protein n=1 Tax=Astathelohania contejeani TaxID=164912 RepID=A0ABQ7I2B6_9MICR|nr:Zinc finger protein [Thelohania contejeani]
MEKRKMFSDDDRIAERIQDSYGRENDLLNEKTESFEFNETLFNFNDEDFVNYLNRNADDYITKKKPLLPVDGLYENLSRFNDVLFVDNVSKNNTYMESSGPPLSKNQNVFNYLEYPMSLIDTTRDFDVLPHKANNMTIDNIQKFNDKIDESTEYYFSKSFISKNKKKKKPISILRKPKILWCNACMIVFSRLSSMKSHILSHMLVADIYRCPACPAHTKSYKLLHEHINQIHPNNAVVLSGIVNRSNNSIILRRHLAIEDCYRLIPDIGENLFSEIFCYNCFKYHYDIVNHECKAKFQDIKICPACNKELNEPLKSHCLSNECKRIIPIIKP